MTSAPRVAIVGRPNVGKSTLFNRLLGRRQAIVHDQPGVTRDRITGEASLGGDRRIEVIDTGGLSAGDDPLGLNRQVLLAIDESDLVLLVVDGKEGLLPADEDIARRLRRSGKPVVLVVNKGDTGQATERSPEFSRLGLEPQVLVSAEHGLGVTDLREILAAALPAEAGQALPATPAATPAVTIVGRPNVGKSSLLNAIVGAPRVIVSEQPGTTRDPVDTLIRRGDREYLLTDTAGIRRRARASGAPEELAVMMARRSIERAEVVILVLDGAAGISSGDLTIAGTIWELGRAALVAVNKWDLVDRDGRERLESAWPRLVEVLADPPRVNLSALTGRGLGRLFPAVDRLLAAFRTSLSTAEVNRLLTEAIARSRPPSDQGRPFKLYYGTQVASGPPTFLVFTNRALPRHHPYRRYLENRLREQLGLAGVPLRLILRKR
jgi:GTP-binding protein